MLPADVDEKSRCTAALKWAHPVARYDRTTRHRLILTGNRSSPKAAPKTSYGKRFLSVVFSQEPTLAACTRRYWGGRSVEDTSSSSTRIIFRPRRHSLGQSQIWGWFSMHQQVSWMFCELFDFLRALPDSHGFDKWPLCSTTNLTLSAPRFCI